MKKERDTKKRDETIKRKKQKMIDALILNDGIVSVAATMAKLNRTTHYDWLKDDTEYKKKVEDIDSMTAEFVESQLMHLIKNFNPQSIMFYLKTKGKKRGWGSSIEVTGDENAPLIWKEVKNYKKEDE